MGIKIVYSGCFMISYTQALIYTIDNLELF